jgi:hypothetical protein
VGGAIRQGYDPGVIEAVIARMEEIDRALPRNDGVAYFNRLYLEVTKAVVADSARTTFADPAFLERLDVVFAQLYFDAEATISSGASCPPAWRPLVQSRSESLEPIQFALAGMNAHINHDLPLAVVTTCTELGLVVDDDTPVRSDYCKVNSILDTVEGQVASWFETGLVADLECITPKAVDRALAMWSVVAARAVAWGHATVLWHLRRHPAIATGYADVLARTTELAGWAMLI